MLPDDVTGEPVMVNTLPVCVIADRRDRRRGRLQVAHPTCPAAERVIGPRALTASVPPAAGMLIVVVPVAGGANVVVPDDEPGKIGPTVGTFKAVAAEKSHVLPDAANVPAFEFELAVSELNAVAAVLVAVNVQSVRDAPALFTQEMVMLVPLMKLSEGCCVCAVPPTSTFW